MTTALAPDKTSRIVSSAATTNATNSKTFQGRLFYVKGFNNAAAGRYLKIYNGAGVPTVGTDVPTHTIYLPAKAAFALDWPTGFFFSTGIGYALTTGSADNDTGAVAAGDILGLNLEYL